MAKRILLWTAYLLPLGYVGMLVQVAIHEVLGHGLTAVLCGGTFTKFVVELDGTGLAYTHAPGHRAEVLIGGTVATLLAGATAIAASYLLRNRLLIRGALLVQALCAFLGSLSYVFWDAVRMTGRGDMSRLLHLEGWAGYRPLLIAVLGILYVASLALTCRLLLRTLEEDMGPLSRGAAAGIALGMVAGIALSSDAFDWNHVAGGPTRAPAVFSIGLQVAVGVWLVVTRRREVVARPVSRRAWAVAMPTAWALAAAAAAVVAIWVRHGVAL